ncbi:MAG: hypothetical protein ACXWJJ_07845 [Ramlibacter sp.]
MHLPAGLAAALAALSLAGCASTPAPAPAPQSAPMAVAPEPAPPPAPPPRRAESDALAPTSLALQHADRVRGLPATDLAQDIARLSALPPAPLVQVQLALTLLQTRTALDGVRAGQLLQRVLAQDTPEARTLHPLCRLLLAQQADQKRLEEQLDRQSQQLRDAQRRADQLNERLDALRAIERTRPRAQ